MTTETYSEIGYPRPSITKDPDAVLDYVFNWTDWLAEEGDTITSYTVTVSGVTKNSDSRSGARVTAWIQGGTVGEIATVTCSIVTSGGRTDQRTIHLRIRER